MSIDMEVKATQAAASIVKAFGDASPELAAKLAAIPGSFAKVADTLAKNSKLSVEQASAAVAKVVDKMVDDAAKAREKADEKATDAAFKTLEDIARKSHEIQVNRIKLLAQVQKAAHEETLARERERAEVTVRGWELAKHGAVEAAQAAFLYGLSGSKSAETVLDGLLKMTAAVKSLGLIDLYKGLVGAGSDPGDRPDCEGTRWACRLGGG